MNEEIEIIKRWLGTGSINIFGLPMSGKDTQGIKLAEALGARFLSSGMIIRAVEEEKHKNYTGKGDLAPSDVFYETVLPYFDREDLKDSALILSSIGRWSGEENAVMKHAAAAGHPIKAVVLLNVSETDVMGRFEAAKILDDRGERLDDRDQEVFENRVKEFREKTLPVIVHYRQLNLLVEVNGDQLREAVFHEIVQKLAEFARQALAGTEK